MADLPVAEIFGQLYAESSDAVALAADGKICMANAALFALLQYQDAAPLLDAPVETLLVGYEHAGGAAQSARVQRVDGVCSAGDRIRVDVYTSRMQHEGVPYQLLLVDRVRLGTVEGLYEAVFSKNTAIKLLLDPKTAEIVDANAPAAKFYGWDIATLRTMSITDINVLSVELAHQRLYSASKGAKRFFRFRHRIASGEVRHVDVHTGQLEVAGRALLLCIVQDTSQRDALERRLRETHKLEAIGRLAGGVAHDFNNLLTVIMGCGERLADSVDEPQRPLLTTLLKAAERAGRLTRNLLTVGHVQPLPPRLVALDEVIAASRDLLHNAVGPNVELVMDLEHNLVVEADPGQLEQVVLNLVLNASEATDGGGHVHVRARLDPQQEQVRLEVEDDGCGMDEALRTRIFDPFFSTKPKGTGTGMGLASACGIVTEAGGTIRVRSAVGEGSTFTVSFPARRLEVTCATPAPTPTTHSSAPRVLVVENEAPLRDLLRIGLEAQGFDVTAMRSGQDANEISDTALAEMDVLVTDQMMPGMTGAELARSLVARQPRLAVVLISGDRDAATSERMPSRAAFVPKPFGMTALVKAVRSVLGR